jgi:hypothetical protein
MDDGKFARWFRIYGAQNFLFLVLVALIFASISNLPENFARNFSALLTPIVALVGGCIAILNFNLNYDKSLNERQKPFLDLIDYVGYLSRQKYLSGSPAQGDVERTQRNIERLLDAEMGMNFYEYMTRDDLAREDFADWSDRFSAAIRAKLRGLS